MRHSPPILYSFCLKFEYAADRKIWMLPHIIRCLNKCHHSFHFMLNILWGNCSAKVKLISHAMNVTCIGITLLKCTHTHTRIQSSGATYRHASIHLCKLWMLFSLLFCFICLLEYFAQIKYEYAEKKDIKCHSHIPPVASTVCQRLRCQHCCVCVVCVCNQTASKPLKKIRAKALKM